MRPTFITVLVLILCSCSFAADNFEELRSVFEENRPSRIKPTDLMEIFREMTELDDPRVIPFLEKEAKKYRLFPAYPDLKFKDINGGQYAGVAQAALAMIGHKESITDLYDQSFHESKVIRYRTLRKIALIDGPIGIALLSNFMGDDTTKGKPMTVLEAEAAFVLSRKLENPPFVFIGDEVPLGDNWGGEPQKAYHSWRYENYGPVPGREMIFDRYSHLTPGSFPKHEDLKKFYKDTNSVPGLGLPSVPNLNENGSPTWPYVLTLVGVIALALGYWIRHR